MQGLFAASARMIYRRYLKRREALGMSLSGRMYRDDSKYLKVRVLGIQTRKCVAEA